MNISRFLTKDLIRIGLQAEERDEILQELVHFLSEKSPIVRNENKLFKAVLEREKKASTGIGMGIAIPHGRTFAVRDFVMALVICPEGRNFNSLDGQPVNLFFIMSAPPDNDTKYLKVIRELSESLRDEEMRRQLISCGDSDTAYFLLKSSGQ